MTAMSGGALRPYFLRSDGWRFVRAKRCDDCGYPIELWRHMNASLGQWKAGTRRRDGVVEPFDVSYMGDHHMRTCPVRRSHTSRDSSRVAPGQIKGPGESQAGPSRDEPVAHMVVRQAAEQVTGRAERRPAPPLPD